MTALISIAILVIAYFFVVDAYKDDEDENDHTNGGYGQVIA